MPKFNCSIRGETWDWPLGSGDFKPPHIPDNWDPDKGRVIACGTLSTNYYHTYLDYNDGVMTALAYNSSDTSPNFDLLCLDKDGETWGWSVSGSLESYPRGLWQNSKHEVVVAYPRHLYRIDILNGTVLQEAGWETGTSYDDDWYLKSNVCFSAVGTFYYKHPGDSADQIRLIDTDFNYTQLGVFESTHYRQNRIRLIANNLFYIQHNSNPDIYGNPDGLSPLMTYSLSSGATDNLGIVPYWSYYQEIAYGLGYHLPFVVDRRFFGSTIGANILLTNLVNITGKVFDLGDRHCTRLYKAPTSYGKFFSLGENVDFYTLKNCGDFSKGEQLEWHYYYPDSYELKPQVKRAIFSFRRTGERLLVITSGLCNHSKCDIDITSLSANETSVTDITLPTNLNSYTLDVSNGSFLTSSSITLSFTAL